MRRHGWMLLVCCMVVGSLTCGAGQVSAKDAIRLGYSIALTGAYSAGAQGQVEAYAVWEEIINKKGGIFVKEEGKRLPVKMVFYDDQSEPGTAARIYEKLLTEDKVDLILPPNNSTIHFAVAPVSQKYKVPLVCGTASSIKLRSVKNEWLFYATSCMPDRQSRALVDMLVDLKVKTATIALPQEMFPREQLQFTEPYLKQAGIEILLVKDYPVAEKDLKTLLSQIKAKNPDAAIFLSYPGDTFTVVTQAQEVGLNPKFMFNLVGTAARSFQPKFGAAAEGIAGMGNWSPKMNTYGNKEFVEVYQAKYKNLPDALNSVEGYKPLQVMEQAIEKAGTLNKDKVRECIQNNEFGVVDGTVKFTGRENLAAVSGILQWQKGSMEVIWPKNIATAKPLYPKPAWPK